MNCYNGKLHFRKYLRAFSITTIICNYAVCMFAGHSSDDLAIAIQCLDVLIGKRRRQVAPQRVIAFVKRLSTLSLQTNANGTLALLALIKTIMSVSRMTFQVSSCLYCRCQYPGWLAHKSRLKSRHKSSP